jgi:hypothetical protein
MNFDLKDRKSMHEMKHISFDHETLKQIKQRFVVSSLLISIAYHSYIRHARFHFSVLVMN